MVVPHDAGDLAVVVHVLEDALPDDRVLLHVAPLLEREGARLLEQARGQADLADVVNKPTQMDDLLFLLRKPHPRGDVTCIDSDRSRVTCGVPVSGVKGCDKRGWGFRS